uniref:Uncharacterized protein n=1 Tax=Arion vulgaris TaxID=1028688 RepID=A0A0B7BCD3_9EUPU
MTRDELATHVRDVLILSAQDMIPRKVHKIPSNITEEAHRFIKSKVRLVKICNIIY